MARTLDWKNDALDLLLFDFLQKLIYYKDTEQLLLRVTEMRIRQSNNQWQLRAKAQGKKLDPSRHRQCVDVKAVTLRHFQLKQTQDGWQAEIILDI